MMGIDVQPKTQQQRDEFTRLNATDN